MIRFFLFTLFLTFLFGCNPLTTLPNSKEFNSYVQWREEELAKLQSYIGFTKDQISASFGKPDMIIRYTNGEFWNYNHHVRSKKVGFFRFYFEKEKVVKVDIT